MDNRSFRMNYRCPDADCAGSQTPLPEAMANATGLKCPVCGTALAGDEGGAVAEPAAVAGGKWEQWFRIPSLGAFVKKFLHFTIFGLGWNQPGLREN